MLGAPGWFWEVRSGQMIESCVLFLHNGILHGVLSKINSQDIWQPPILGFMVSNFFLILSIRLTYEPDLQQPLEGDHVANM